jgi:hypothetical protein
MQRKKLKLNVISTQKTIVLMKHKGSNNFLKNKI